MTTSHRYITGMMVNVIDGNHPQNGGGRPASPERRTGLIGITGLHPP